MITKLSELMPMPNINDLHQRELDKRNSLDGEVWPTGTKPPIELLNPPAPDPMIGKGGAPTRETTLPTAPSDRKRFPLASGVDDYFPDALVAISEVSFVGNEQHNPGQPLHWNRAKSGDESDALKRHFLARGTRDTDGLRHSAKLAWRALALLQKEIEAEQKSNIAG